MHGGKRPLEAYGAQIAKKRLVLAAPHIMRKFVGDDYRFLIPCSAAAGALLLTAADAFGRLIVSPVILPVGAITSFLGAPVFLLLLMKGGGRR